VDDLNHVITSHPKTWAWQNVHRLLFASDPSDSRPVDQPYWTGCGLATIHLDPQLINDPALMAHGDHEVRPFIGDQLSIVPSHCF